MRPRPQACDAEEPAREGDQSLLDDVGDGGGGESRAFDIALEGALFFLAAPVAIPATVGRRETSITIEVAGDLAGLHRVESSWE